LLASLIAAVAFVAIPGAWRTNAAPLPATRFQPLGPAPYHADCLFDHSPLCMTDVRDTEFDFSSHFYRVGEIATATMTSGWQEWHFPGDLPGLTLQECTGDPNEGGGTCRWRVTGRTGWVAHGGLLITVPGSNAYTENDFYAVIGEDYMIDGNITEFGPDPFDPNFDTEHPAAGARVNIAGRSDDEGPLSFRQQANSDGYYYALFPKGTYTVSSSVGCVVGERPCRSSKEVRLPGDQTVDFKEEVFELSGKVESYNCSADPCTRQPWGGLEMLAVRGGRTSHTWTDGAGAFTMRLGKGTYALTPNTTGYNFSPASRRVELTQDRRGQDFVACANPSAGQGATASGPACFSIYGKVTKRTCGEHTCRAEPFANATVAAVAGGQRWQTVSGGDGTYRLAALPGSRTYEVTAAYNDGTTDWEFDPPSTSVILDADKRDIHFATCVDQPPAARVSEAAASPAPSCYTISGTILKGPRVNEPYRPDRPAQAIRVQVVGTTAEGDRLTRSVKTDRAGKYKAGALKAGVYTVTFPRGVCARIRSTTCSTTQRVELTSQEKTKKADAIKLEGALEITMTLSPSRVELRQTVEGVTPRNVDLTVRVKNTSRRDVEHVTLQELQIGFVEIDHADTVPLNVIRGPLERPSDRTPSPNLGTIRPGAHKERVYRLSAEGDGTFNIDILVTGEQNDRPLRPAGYGNVELPVTSQLLVFTTELQENLPRLIRAGRTVLIYATLENRSYVKTLAIDPIFPKLEGNASDGHLIDKLAIVPNWNQPEADDVCRPSTTVEIPPREKVELKAVIRTHEGDVFFTDTGELPGGTRAVITFEKPTVFTPTEGDYTRVRSADIVLPEDSTEYTLHLDDSQIVQPTSAWLAGEIAYWTAGMVIYGVPRFFGGLLHGVFIDLPRLALQGIAAAPKLWVHSFNYLAELMTEVLAEPDLYAAVVFKVVELLQQAGYEFENLERQVDAQLKNYFRRYSNQWAVGDWQGATAELGADFGELAMNVFTINRVPPAAVRAVGRCVLPRVPQALEGLKNAKTALYTRVAESLSQADQYMPSREALAALERLVKPGFEFTPHELRYLMGMTAEQVNWLKDYADRKNLLITVRSRAMESIEWIRRGAVLKPEQIKTKNVSFIDRLLGWKYDDVGRIVIRKPIGADQTLGESLQRVKQYLRTNHPEVAEGSTEWTEALKRHQDRWEEWHHGSPSDGYPDQLLKWGEEGELPFTWDLNQNLMDVGRHVPSGQRYKFRMRVTERDAAGRPIEWVPEVCVPASTVCPPNSSGWRSITGDIDGVSITHANGDALTDAQQIAVMNDLHQSPVQSLHGFTATWKRNGQFDFEDKRKYLFIKCCAAQFAPDRVVRAVKPIKELSELINPENYYIHYQGGYKFPRRLVPLRVIPDFHP
jgi:hypothetical protein